MLLKGYTLHGAEGSLLQSGAVLPAMITHYGVELELQRTVQQVPPGQELLLVLSLDAELWPHSRFPCAASEYSDDPGSCDWVITGHAMTAEGQRMLMQDGSPAASCCPRGAVFFGDAL